MKFIELFIQGEEGEVLALLQTQGNSHSGAAAPHSKTLARRDNQGYHLPN